MSGFTAAEMSVLCKTLAKVYEDRAEDCTRAAERTNDPVLHKLLLALASKWKQLAAQEKGKSRSR